MQYSFFDKMTELISKKAGKTALQIKRNGGYVKYSYEDFYKMACGISRYLKELGVKKGDNVALFSENGPEWVIAYFGIHATGAAVVPLDSQYTDRELSNLLPYAGVKIILCSSALYEKTIKILDNELKFKKILIIDAPGENSIFDLPPADSPAASRDENDVMSMIFTSGTTGDPKGVMLTDKNFLSNIESINKLGVVTEKDNILAILPMHHCFSFTATILLPLLNGGSITFQPSLKGPDILAAMNETGVTKMAGVPQLFSIFEKNIFGKIEKLGAGQRKIFNLLYKLSEFVYDKTGYMLGKKLFKKISSAFGPSFDLFVSGGAKLDPKTAKNFAVLGLEILEGFGLTETAPVLTLNPPGKARIGSCGKPLPGVEIKILNPDKEGVGEIIARGPNIMPGYYNHPESTAEVIKDGWFYTGDLGYLDKDGYLFITGRAKDVIVMASGKNVYPDEVEKHYQKTPYVAEMCVMAEDSKDGKIEKLRAIVVPNYRLFREQNIANCTHYIKCEFEELSLKIPTYMRITDFKIISEELPRTRLGKLKRAEIKKRGLFDRTSDDAVKKPELTPEELTLMAEPIAEKLVERVKKLTGKTEAAPRDNLELDLGIDSLTRLELLVILESEFGVKVKETEASSLIHLKDLLEKVVKEGKISEPTGASGFLEAIRKEPEVPFTEAYDLRPGIFASFFKWTLKRIVYAFFSLTCGIKVRGLENIQHKKAFLLCPNHTSYIDPVLMFLILPDFFSKRTFFFALEEMFGGPYMAWMRRLLKIITSGTENSMIRSLQYSSKALSKGFPICIFPEGQRTIDMTLMRPKKGFAILAGEHHVPIYPVYIDGALNMFSKPNPGFTRAPLTVTIGEPIMPPDKTEFKEEDYELMMKLWYLSVLKLGPKK